MIVLRDDDMATFTGRPSVVTIGIFDGLHRGHQRIIRETRALAEQRGALLTVVTFDPHPAWVLASDRAPALLATLDQRLEGLEQLRVDQVRVVTFDRALANESAVTFIERVLEHQLHTIDVVVGEDFRFGNDRVGDVALLEVEGARRGFGVVPSPIHGTPARWSSTAVRRALREDDLALANDILGRPFTVRAGVVHGDGRGADLGYPTANLDLAIHQQIPHVGIYAGAVRTTPASWWPAAISVGTRPQFYDDGALLVEVHIPGLDTDLYDAQLDVSFLTRLRGEQTFNDVDALVTQIGRDVEQTVEIFEKFSPTASALLE
jgi:riboflavin kinase/FMN adenylyltransferase